VRNRWLSGQAIALHVGAFVIIAIMLGLGWWQVQCALDGNTRSWAYAVQWPAFAAYAVYMWWKLVHDLPAFGGRKPVEEAPPVDTRTGDDRPVGPVHLPATEHPSARRRREAERAAAEERAMAEYNEYLAGLDAGGTRPSNP
jgi:hypothetical protein